MLTFLNALIILSMGVGLGITSIGVLWMLRDRNNDEKHKGRYDGR